MWPWLPERVVVVHIPCVLTCRVFPDHLITYLLTLLTYLLTYLLYLLTTTNISLAHMPYTRTLLQPLP